jgi:hypothetical protein
MTTEKEDGRYLYGIVAGSHADALGAIGLDGAAVFLVPAGEFSAVVHDCATSPYDSQDADRVHAWVLAHQEVVDAALTRYGNALPMGFNTIVARTASEDAETRLLAWLEENRASLVEQLGRLEGRREYGVQIFYELSTMMEKAAHCEEVRRFQAELAAKGKGAAYVFKSKLEKKLREEVDRLTRATATEYLELFRAHTDDLVADKAKDGARDAPMLMNLSVLLPADGVTGFGHLLEQVNEQPGLRVRFTGPWAPYSFVRPL